MIGFIKGMVKSVQNDTLLILVESIGYEIFTPNATAYTLGSSIELYTYLHWNQEQGPTFFGFRTNEEKTVFLLIIKCPGIGPKIGLAALEHLGAGSFIQAIAREDLNALSSISGIGKKKAEQMVVQLRHHVAKLLDQGVSFGQNTNLAELQKISEVLNSLNYSRSEINNALELIRKNEQENVSFDLLLRKALSYLSKRA